MGFECEELKDLNASPVGLYKLGNFRDIPVYVDPMLKYTQDQLAVVDNNFFEYEVDEKTTKIITEGTGAPKIQLEFKYKLHNPESKVYKVTDVEL